MLPMKHMGTAVLSRMELILATSLFPILVQSHGRLLCQLWENLTARTLLLSKLILQEIHGRTMLLVAVRDMDTCLNQQQGEFYTF